MIAGICVYMIPYHLTFYVKIVMYVSSISDVRLPHLNAKAEQDSSLRKHINVMIIGWRLENVIARDSCIISYSFRNSLQTNVTAERSAIEHQLFGPKSHDSLIRSFTRNNEKAMNSFDHNTADLEVLVLLGIVGYLNCR